MSRIRQVIRATGTVVRSEFVISRSPVQVWSPAPKESTCYSRLSEVRSAGLSGGAIGAVLLMALVGLGVSSGASAQTTEPTLLKIATITYSSAAAADWISTARASCSPTWRETNPLINWAPTPTTTVALGAALDATSIWAWRKYVGRTHPKLATVGLFAMSGFRAYLVGYNERLKR